MQRNNLKINKPLGKMEYVSAWWVKIKCTFDIPYLACLGNTYVLLMKHFLKSDSLFNEFNWYKKDILLILPQHFFWQRVEWYEAEQLIHLAMLQICKLVNIETK